MKIENQVCTLEQAKRLKELGVEQVANLYWKEDTDKDRLYDPWIGGEKYAAFTVAELGVMIGSPIGEKVNSYTTDGATGSYLHGSHITTTHSEHEAHIRADVLIHLLENNIITAEEVNTRLTS